MEETKHLHIEFFTEPKQDKRRSKEEGRPIYKDEEFVRIKFVGDPKRELVAPAKDKFRRAPEGGYLTYADAYPRHYEAFKKGQELIGEGTPLAELPFLTEAKRAELKALNIHTAEALAHLDGANLQRLKMGGRDLKNQAQAWIEKANGSADLTRFAAENASLHEQIEALKAQMSDLMVSHEARQDSARRAVQASDTPSPFSDWDDDTIRVWIEEQGGEKPHHKCSHETLVQKADELNAKIAKQKEAA